jgi:hypothetical protein
LAVTVLSGSSNATLSSRESCDLIGLRSDPARGSALVSSWQIYRKALVEVMRIASKEALSSSQLGERINNVQASALSQVSQNILASYRGSDQCVVITNLRSDFFDNFQFSLKSEPLFGPFAPLLTKLVVESLDEMKAFLSRARFRSRSDQLSAQAGYYCFVASIALSIASEWPNNAMRSVGETQTCAEAAPKDGR